MRTAALPTAVTASLLFFCTAATPGSNTGQNPGDLDTVTAPLRPGDWPMPDLIRNTPPEPDPTTLTTTDLAEDATSPADQPTTPITLTSAARAIPAQLLAAYQQAARTLADTAPGCNLPWELLAAIGKVESGHAQGRPITTDGTITRPILGPALNGANGVALIRDTDNGTLDNDTTYDRAVGPMQFIPTTWATSGRDGNNDGRKNPHNIHDADLAAGHYLCARGRDLTDPADLRAAILSYNPSDAYVRTVLTWLGGYRQGGATPQTGTGNSSGSSDTGTSGTGDPIPETTASTASPNGLEGSGLGDIPIVTLTPTRPPTSPGSPPPAGPTSSPDPTPAGPTPPPTPDPDEEWELEACHPLRADDLAVTVTDLDPATPGAEALDITTTRRPWRTTTVTVETTATTTSGTPVASTRLQLEDDQEAGTPALLARIPGTSLANANLPDNALLLTLKATPADQHCPTHIRLRIRNITPAAFAPRPPAPTTTPPAPPPPASPPAASASPPAPPSTSTPPTPATTSAAPPDVSPSPSAT